MNPANLQIETLIMAVAGLNRLLVEKGIATPHEIEAALRQAAACIISVGPHHFPQEEHDLLNGAYIQTLDGPVTDIQPRRGKP